MDIQNGGALAAVYGHKKRDEAKAPPEYSRTMLPWGPQIILFFGESVEQGVGVLQAQCAQSREP